MPRPDCPVCAKPMIFYSCEIIGLAEAAIVAGALTRPIAEAAGFPYATVRDWRRRHRDRGATLAAGFAALAVELGAVAPGLASVAERAALEALGCAWATAPVPLLRQRLRSARTAGSATVARVAERNGPTPGISAVSG